MLYNMDTESEIVISGLSGRFPDSDNLDEFWQNLIDGKDMITNDHDRFKVDEKTMPTRMGVIKTLEAFDADFFAVHGKQSDVMDPRTRKLLEVSYEALLDAGVNPATIRGTRTGVFVGGSESDAGGIWRRSNTKMNFYGVLGNILSMMAGRLSFIFGFTGPSYVVDTACSASSVALQQALLNIRTGQCDAALVAGAHLHHDPASTYMFQQLEMTSKDGKCKVFDASADGYVRAEAIVAIYICKKDVAKRSYATIVHAATNNDGYKEQGITFPSVVLQEKVIRQVYEESGVDPLEVDYIEAHGTGTKVGDPEEMLAVSKVFCEGRKGPLLVGSVKSNMGHSEVVSGLCSIAKIILAHSAGIIPANLHYKVPNPDIPALHDGRIQIVDKNMTFNPTYIGMSSMGFGGTNVHVLLKMNPRKPEEQEWNPPIPLILPCSGRTQEAVEHYLQTALTRRQNRNFVCLLHEVIKQDTPKHVFRGFVVVEPEKMEIVVERQEPKRSMWFVLPGLGSQWLGMSRDLIKFDAFRKSLDISTKALAEVGYDLARVFQSEDVKIFDNLKNAVVPITAIQVALIDLLSYVGIKPEGIVGHSTGEVAAGYADGCLTQEQAVLVALGRARAVLESNCPPGTVASVGLTWEDAQKRCPAGVYPVIHNARENVTIAGPPEAVQNFVKQLESEGVFAKAVRSASFAFHSPMVDNSGPVAQKLLEKIIPEPKERSKKWLSSSVPEDKWNTDLAKYCSPAYYVNNGVKPVYFYPALLHIPEQSIALEIAPHCFMQTILKQSLPASVVKLGLIHCKSPDNCVYFLNSLGKCYLAGVTIDVGALYEPVQFPITDCVPNISSMIRWDHTTAWDVPHHTKELSRQRGTKYSFHLLFDTDAFLEGHKVDDKIVFPATGYLWLVWTFFANQRGCALDQQPIVFEDVRFERVTLLNKRNQTDFLINIFVGSGRFEIVESEMVVCSGVIRDIEDSLESEMFNYELIDDIDTTGAWMNRDDFYNEMHLRGYGHSGLFQGIHQVDLDSNWARIEWMGNWITFMDCIMQSFMLHRQSRDLCLPIRMEKLAIDPIAVTKYLSENNNIATVKAWKMYNTGTTPGCEVRGLHFAKFSQRSHSVKPITSENIFMPYKLENPAALSEAQAVESSLEVVTENSFGGKFVFTEIFDNIENMISHLIISQLILNFMSLDFRTVNESGTEIEDENKNKSGSKIMTFEEAKSCEPNHLILVDAQDRIADAATMVIPNGFLLYKGQTTPVKISENLTLISQRPYTTEKHGENTYFLYRNIAPIPPKITTIVVDESDFKWVEAAKNAVQTIADTDRLIFSSTSAQSGIIGFVRCMAREISSEKLRCFFAIDDLQLDFNNPSTVLRAQLDKDLLFNVYKDNTWGNFSNVIINEADFEKRITSTHAYANALRLGQLSTLCWVESPLKLVNSELIEVHYAALNFRDIMLASGKLVQDALSAKAARDNCVLGLEFSGVYKGKRVFGMGNSECLATHIDPNRPLVFDIPSNWSFAEAATVPTVYCTVYYALLHKAHMEEGETILIHAGSGGVGQAAIAVALSMNCKIITTVSTQEKRDFLKERFPALTEENFANSRDAKDFERHVKKFTNGKGVDLILNSLAQEKLFASLRCLGKNGRFLEIGKFDVFNNTNIGLNILSKGATIYGIYADDVTNDNSKNQEKLQKFIQDGIESNTIIPLSKTIFKHDQLEEAFRYMAQGKHVGKVVIQVKDDENTPAAIPALPRTYFSSAKSYLIIGGLGGMGFELVDWMISRGAKKFVLASRSGVRSTYHDYHMRIWERDEVTVEISRSDAATLEGTQSLLQTAENLGPLGGIFNTALVLKDNLFAEQTPEAFEEVLRCKANATINLDKLSRNLQSLDHFVVFSSIVAARGNPGQTNYGLANSVMERVCEQRKAAGLPALAMQWGAVADVGVVHRTMKDRPLFGLDTQKLLSCLETLDMCLQQDKTIVSSFVRGATSDFSKINPNDSLVNIAAQILGIKDLTKVNPKTPLVELGMDSLMAAELSQALATKRNIQMSKKEYAQLNFEKLEELDKNKVVKEKEKSIGSWVSQQQQQQTQLENLLKLRVSSGTGVVKMNSLNLNKETIFMVHPMDGTADMIEPLVSGMNANVYGIECTKEAPLESLGRLADFYLQRIQEIQPKGPYKIGGYSFGANVAFEIVRQLEQKNEAVSLLLLLDTTPKYKTYIKSFKGDEMDKEDWENAVLLKFLRHYICPIPYTVGTDLHNMEVLAQKCSYLARLLQETQHDLSLDEIRDLTMAFKLRADIEKAYEARNKIQSRTVLLKALKTEDEKEVPYDYGLAEICEGVVEVVNVDGNHYCFYERCSELGIPEIVNKLVDSYSF